jgi:hypothetical protein
MSLRCLEGSLVVSNNPNVSCDQKFQPKGLPAYVLCNKIDKGSNSISLLFYGPMPGDTPYLKLYLSPVDKKFYGGTGYEGPGFVTAGSLSNIVINQPNSDSILISLEYSDSPSRYDNGDEGYIMVYQILMNTEGIINDKKSCVSTSTVTSLPSGERNYTIEQSQKQTGTIFYNNENFFDLSVNNHKRSHDKRSKKRCQKKCVR